MKCRLIIIQINCIYVIFANFSNSQARFIKIDEVMVLRLLYGYCESYYILYNSIFDGLNREKIISLIYENVRLKLFSRLYLS